MSCVLDYAGPTDLIKIALTSKRMREMAYDDTRWVRRLKQIGCWNELEARKHSEQVNGMPVTAEIRKHPQSPTTNGTRRRSSARKASLTDGFDHIAVQALGLGQKELMSQGEDVALHVLKQVKSIRGQARQEYGKVHSILSPYYNDIIRTGGSSDSTVFSRYSDPERQAKILSQLIAFAKSDSTQGWDIRERQLLNIVANFEDAALREFRQGYETDDIDGLMRRYTHVLCKLNGGQSAIDSYLRYNHLITQKSQLGTITDCIERETGDVKLEHTQAFLIRFGVAYNEEISVIDRTFPAPDEVIPLFLETICSKVLSPFLTTLFDELQRINKESYLKAVSGTFAQCMTFMKDLRLSQGSGEEFSVVVVGVMSKIYEPHIDLYLAEELDFFRQGCDATVQDWDRQLSEQAASTESFMLSNVNRQADKKDFLSTFKKVVMMPINILPTFGTKSAEKVDAANDESSNPKNVSRFSTVATPVPASLSAAPSNELAAKVAIMNTKLEGIRSLFSIEVALSLIHSAKISIERAANFVHLEGSYSAAAKQQCEAIFLSLLDILGRRHVIEGFDKAVEHLSNYKPREHEGLAVEPLVTFLELVNVGDLILQMIDVFYEQELVGSRLTDRSDFLDPAVRGKKKFEQVLDERVASGLNKGINVLIDEVEYIFATKQLAIDYNPEVSIDPNRQTMDVGTTAAAIAVAELVSSHTQMLVGSTDKSTLDVFNQEVGLRLFGSLCKHLKRQRISIEGSLKLIRWVLCLIVQYLVIPRIADSS